jgi:putative transposase
VFADESGFCLVAPLRHTWARRGQTPRTRTRIEHQQRVNAIGFLAIKSNGGKPRAIISLTQGRVNGEAILRVLRRLLAQIRGPIVLVWDNAKIHTQKKVTAFIAKHRRLHVYNFPTYAPELNPVEYLWANANIRIANVGYPSMTHLTRRLRYVFKRIGTNAKLLRGFLAASNKALRAVCKVVSCQSQ